ncbi:sensor histidine kinase [Nocardioides sp. MAHUQ-72]|uniref:sensor histidine kinase n=1 Tax=unclassified Nocardioides TaxID=2615069 RepID=UPI003608102E
MARRLIFADEPDPRALQGVFALLFLLGRLLRDLGGDGLVARSWPALGIAVAVVACVAAVVVPWSRLPVWAVAVLPVLDLAALGLSRLDPQTSGPGILAVVPALWLGRQLGRTGAWIAMGAALALIAVPGLLYFGTSGLDVSRVLLIVVVVGWSALAIASGIDRVRAGQGTIEHQRRVSDAILDTVDVGLVLLDADGRYESMNRHHRAMMAIAFPDGHEGVAGQLGDVYAADGATLLTREDMPTFRASHGEEFDDHRIWIGCDPLTRRALSVSARTVRDGRGRVAGAALAYKDVTALMSALRVKDEFVASVSHELRTPLTSIAGYVSILLERQDLPPEVLAQLEIVDRNTERLRRLVADLLHTAQVDEGPMHVVRTRCDVCEIVREAVRAAGPAAQAAGVELDLEVPGQLHARVDPQRFAQVVDNLVSNAVKYTPAGGRAHVGLGVDGDRLELVVADTGIGITAADRARLFTRFFRARHAEEQSIQGVGLGLSITRSIVEGHGGRIEVDSEVGRGSVFRVRIPLDVEQESVRV